MLHRHLLPGELELLLDGEEGFGVPPVRAHLESCSECQARLAVERELVELLEHVPHVAPGAGFQDRVMSQVQVFEPWHVTARDTLRLLIPPPGPWRVLVGAGIAGSMVSLSALVIWVTLRFDLALYLGQLAIERTQGALVSTAGTVLHAVLGDAAPVSLQAGGAPAMLAALGVIGAALVGATLGLRGLVAVARRRRS